MNKIGPSATGNASATTAEDERARLRRNQRNSRARKQAYIQDLEQRWNACVRLGAQASVEMQKEARRIQEENRLLRALLHKLGLDDMAIQEAVSPAQKTEGKETGSPDFNPSSRYAMMTGTDLATPGPQSSTLSNAPQSHAQELHDALPFVGNPARLDIPSNVYQELNFNAWLADFSNIQDVFSFDAPIQRLHGSDDVSGTAIGYSPQLAIDDAQHYADLGLPQEEDWGIPGFLDLGNTQYV